MNINTIERLILEGESETVEFKTSTAQLKRAFETICAFLNGKGGMILIGVNDKGRLVGQAVTDNTRQEIARELGKLEPTVPLEVAYIPLATEKFIIAIKVEQSRHAPYIYNGRAFHRYQSTTVKMSQHRYEQLLVARGQLNYSWEAASTVGYTVEELDHKEIRLAVNQGIAAGRIPVDIAQRTIEEILSNWELIKEDQLNNASVVLFAKRVRPDYPQCHIRLGRFRGNDTLGEMLDSQSIFGNVFYLLRETDHFIRRHLPIASYFDVGSFERIDSPSVPVFAVREALVNAFSHCDYSNRSTSISLAIFDDHMEIWNNGELPPNLHLEHLNKKHQSVPRNPNIAKVFYDRKFFDGWGMGIAKIFRLCKESGLPEPKYEFYSGGTAILFKFREPIFSVRETNSVTYQVSPLSARQKQLLKILEKHASMTLSELRAQLENAPAARTIRDDLAYLKSLQFVELTGFGRGARWSIPQKEAVKRR